MRIKTFVVIDTNVLVSAMLSNSKALFGVLELVERGNLTPIFDKRIQSVKATDFCPITDGIACP